MIPVLHLEAHGSEDGLAGPDGSGGQDVLRWDELTGPLQRLNLATRCNLIVVVAACTGFAAIKALTRGPRAPAVALVGPDAEAFARDLLEGTKEFYRRFQDKNAGLRRIVESASQQAGRTTFEPEPFAALFYEAFVEGIIISMRSNEMQLMQVLPTISQRIWDEMFMIDLYPENRARFGLDIRPIVDQIARETR